MGADPWCSWLSSVHGLCMARLGDLRPVLGERWHIGHRGPLRAEVGAPANAVPCCAGALRVTSLNPRPLWKVRLGPLCRSGGNGPWVLGLLPLEWHNQVSAGGSLGREGGRPGTPGGDGRSGAALGPRPAPRNGVVTNAAWLLCRWNLRRKPPRPQRPRVRGSLTACTWTSRRSGPSCTAPAGELRPSSPPRHPSTIQPRPSLQTQARPQMSPARSLQRTQSSRYRPVPAEG